MGLTERHWFENEDVPENYEWNLEDVVWLKEQEPLIVYEDKINKCVCGNEINRYWHPEYCGFCGKKLEWY